MNDIDKTIYIMMESRYLEANGREGIVNDNLDLYPQDWFGNEDYRLKTEILTEAITNHILIKDTESYQEIIEGVRISR